MRSIVSVASVFFCAVSLNGQITASIRRLPENVDEVRIRNDSAAVFVAFAATVGFAHGSANSIQSPFVWFSDPLVDIRTTPLAPGDERLIASRRPDYSAMKRVFEEPTAAAGILADGTPSGDPALLSRLLLRRSNMLQAVELAIDTLTDAGNRNYPKAQLINEFKRLTNSLDRWYLPPEQQVGRS